MSKKEDSKDLTRQKQLENLKKGQGYINKKNAKEMQLKSAEKRKENNFYLKAAQKELEKLLNKGALQNLTSDFNDLKPAEKLAILEHLRDSSGQKPKDIPEAIVMPVINIKGL